MAQKVGRREIYSPVPSPSEERGCQALRQTQIVISKNDFDTIKMLRPEKRKIIDLKH